MRLRDFARSSAPAAGPAARNFGQVKGDAFVHVLIHPTGSITGSLENRAALADVTAAKFHVVVTRARHSVGIVTTWTTTNSGLPRWIHGHCLHD